MTTAPTSRSTRPTAGSRSRHRIRYGTVGSKQTSILSSSQRGLVRFLPVGIWLLSRTELHKINRHSIRSMTDWAAALVEAMAGGDSVEEALAAVVSESRRPQLRPTRSEPLS